MWLDVAIILFFVAMETKGCHLCFLQKTLPRLQQVHPNQPLPSSFSEYVLESRGVSAVICQSVSRRMHVIDSSEHENVRLVWKQSDEGENNSRNSDNDTVVSSSDDQGLKELMISWIKWYRTTLSPIMPPNCRFFPSCSNYAIDAIERYGAIKGGVLTAWRILRCNPFGGAGYDPPIWPPPGFFAGSNKQRW